MKFPDLAHFRSHTIVEDIDLEGVVVPGLRAEFLRSGGATLGRYTYAGQEVFRAWGYEGEEHCRYFAVLGVDGAWEPPQPGCPRVRVLANGGGVFGLALHSSTGEWLVALRPAAQERKRDRGRRRPPLRPTAGSAARPAAC